MQAPYNLTQQPGFERKANSFGANLTAWHTIHGVCQGPGITVVPVSDLVKERELPSKWRPLVQQAAGHCRSRSESACVRKLLQAVRAANVSPNGQEGDASSTREPSTRPHSAKQWRASGLRSPQVKPGSFGPPSPLQRPRSARQRAKGMNPAPTFPNGNDKSKVGARPRPHSASAARAKSQNESMRRLYAQEPSGVGPSGRNLRFPTSSSSPVGEATVRMPTQNFAATGGKLSLEVNERAGNALQDDEEKGVMRYSPIRKAAAAAERGMAHPSKRLSQGTGRFEAVPKASTVIASPGKGAHSALSGAPRANSAFAEGAAGSPNHNRKSLTNHGGSTSSSGESPKPNAPPPLLGIVQSPLGDLIGDPPPPLRYGKFVNMVTRVGVPLPAVRHMVSQEPGLTQEGFDAALKFAGADVENLTDAVASTPAAPSTTALSVSPVKQSTSRSTQAHGMVTDDTRKEHADDDSSTAVTKPMSLPPHRPALPSGLVAGISGGGSRLKTVNRSTIRDASAPSLASSNYPTTNSAGAAASLAALVEDYEKWVSNDSVTASLPLQHLFHRRESAAISSGQDSSEVRASNETLSWERSEVLGAGRYATVTVATEKTSAATPARANPSSGAFAVKEFTFSGASAPEGVLRAWQRETSALLALDRAAAATPEAMPLIVRLLGCCVSPPRLALELAPLGSLGNYLKKCRQTTSFAPHVANSEHGGGAVDHGSAAVAAEVATAAHTSFPLLRDVAAALAFVHGAGWCHLDVKDHNVVLRQRHDPNSSEAAALQIEAILADFGTAARLGDQASSTSALRAGAGTSGSAAPELLAAAEALEAHAAGATASHTMGQGGGINAGGESVMVHGSSSSAEVAEVVRLVAKVGAPADVFSFGILLWRCLAPSSQCANPLAGLDGAAALAALNRGVRPPWPLAQSTTSTSPSSTAESMNLEAVKRVGELLQRCWALEPEARPPMAEVCRVLGGVRWSHQKET